MVTSGRFSLIFSTMITILCSFLLYQVNPIISSSQTVVVQAQTTANPGYIWCQHSDGRWSTYSTIDGYQVVENYHDEPKEHWVTTAATIPIPSSNNWYYEDGYSLESNREVINIVIKDASGLTGDNQLREAYVNEEENKVYISGYSGKSEERTWFSLDGTEACGGNNGMIYPMPIEVFWEGEVVIPEGKLVVKHFTEEGESLNHVFTNYALPGGTVILRSFGYTSPTLATNQYTKRSPNDN